MQNFDAECTNASAPPFNSDETQSPPVPPQTLPTATQTPSTQNEIYTGQSYTQLYKSNASNSFLDTRDQYHHDLYNSTILSSNSNVIKDNNFIYTQSVKRQRSGNDNKIYTDIHVSESEKDRLAKLDTIIRNSNKNFLHYNARVKTHIDHHLLGYSWHDKEHRLCVKHLMKNFNNSIKIKDLLLNGGEFWIKIEREYDKVAPYIEQGDMDYKRGKKFKGDDNYIINIHTQKRRKLNEKENPNECFPLKRNVNFSVQTVDNSGNVMKNDVNKKIVMSNKTKYTGSMFWNEYPSIQKLLFSTPREVVEYEKHLLNIWKEREKDDILKYPEQLTDSDKENIKRCRDIFKKHCEENILFTSIVVTDEISQLSLSYTWCDEMFIFSVHDFYSDLIKTESKIFVDLLVNPFSLMVKIKKNNPHIDEN